MASAQHFDPHSILGLARTASQTEIKQAHRRLAIECAAGQLGRGDAAEQRLKDINAARTMLDRQGKAAPRRTSQKTASPFSARSRTQARSPRQPPRAAARFYGELKVDGLQHANRAAQQTKAASAASSKGKVRSTFAGGPKLRPVGFCY